MKTVATLLLTVFAFALISLTSAAQCPPGQIEFELVLVPDNYPNEISWELKNSQGIIILNGTSNGATVCINDNECHTFTIYDSYGDGICCGYGNGSYEIIVDGTSIATGGQYTNQESVSFNCPPGSNCENPILIGEGTFTAPNADTWYEFSPDSVGMYNITTCGMNNCDTKIWVYDYCQGLVFDNTNIATIYYDDNQGGCGMLAQVNALLDTAETYWIRIGTANGDCSGTIDWSISWNGPAMGCMDPTACNFNPLAQVPDTCYYLGSPDCPSGPDLLLREDVLESSLYLDILNNADNCAINEGCLQGYGNRDILRFTTHIQNIGDMDYYIGDPNNNPDQFTYDNCHNHNHYDGYAEYILFDSNSQPLPIGFKNGFCVMDLECSGGGTAQYGCSTMGISHGCGDIYDASLTCQWIDITDVDTGQYTLVVRTNWDHAPDALGHYETDSLNNWAQVCIQLDRDQFGTPSFTVLPNCPPLIDCMGVPYGNAVEDCQGTCGGTALMGDIDSDLAQSMIDAHQYVTDILGDDISPTTCNDLNADGYITVYDAALMAGCINYGSSHSHQGQGSHNHCNFPDGLRNINDTVTLSITNVDLVNQYIDISILNPTTRVVAYQFEMSGIEISTVQNLSPPQEYPITPEYAFGMGEVIGLSYEDSTIDKNFVYEPLCRIYYSNITANEICLDTIIDIVNKDYEQTVTMIEGGCIQITGIEDENSFTIFNVAPNPSKNIFNVDYRFPRVQDVQIEVTNYIGQRVIFEELNNTEVGKYIIDLTTQSNGIYMLNLYSEEGVITRKLVLNR